MPRLGVKNVEGGPDGECRIYIVWVGRRTYMQHHALGDGAPGRVCRLRIDVAAKGPVTFGSFVRLAARMDQREEAATYRRREPRPEQWSGRCPGRASRGP